MKPHHAVALALVGWYLLSPPFNGQKDEIPIEAPLAQWTQDEAFDSASACEDARQQIIEATSRIYKEKKDRVSKFNMQLRFESRCIASDDPRLKGKEDNK